MKYAAVIFDLFGTLVDNFSYQAYRDVLAQMAAALSVAAQDFANAWLDRSEMDARMAGCFPSTEASLARTCVIIGCAADSTEIAEAARLRVDFTRHALEPRKDALETLNALRSRGLKIGLISDCTWEVPGLWPATPFAPLFDTAVFSCAVGCKKPDPPIYRTACERLGVAPESCLYVGDGSSKELTGALQVGMRSILIKAPHGSIYELYAPEVSDWSGPVISTLGQVLGLLE